MLSEAVKILKGEYALRAIKVHNMDKAIVFCRTKVDCDNMENYLNKAGGGRWCILQPENSTCCCLAVPAILRKTAEIITCDVWHFVSVY